MERRLLPVKLDSYQPLREVVCETLREAIISGVLRPGERLMEIQLAEELGVSRTPVREAIRKLELEGLVTMVPRRGAQEAQITEKSMSDVLEVRRALDELAVELACLRITQEEKEQLKEACLNFEKIVITNDVHEIAKADVAFHDIIFAATGNGRLSQMVNNLAEQMYRYRYEYIKDEKQHDMLVKEHRKIYDSIIANDTDSAKEAIRIHIENQEKAILRQIRLEKE